MTMFPPMCEKHKKIMTLSGGTEFIGSWQCNECIEELRVAWDSSWLSNHGTKVSTDTVTNDVAPMHPREARFFEIVKENCELHKRKSADYGNGEDPFANVMASIAWGIEPWIGVMIRVCDKIKRLQSLVQNGKLVNESAIDSFRDIALYTQMAQELFEEYLKKEALKTETELGESGFTLGPVTYKEAIQS